MSHNILLFLVVMGIISHGSTSFGIKITKIICNWTDSEFGQVESCILKPESRYVQSVKFRIRVLQLPITHFKVRVQIMKRLNGWKPFLYDVTVGCNFTSHLNKLTRFAWQIIRNATNLRRSDCPLNQSIFQAERVTNKYIEDAFKILPIPTGDYGAFATFSLNNKTRGNINVFGTIF